MKNKITKLTLSEDITSFLKKNKFLSKDDNTFNYNTDLFDYGYLDSFGIVQLILFIEKKYKCDLSNEDFYNELRSVDKIALKILS